jgi:hypothetical protein
LILEQAHSKHWDVIDLEKEKAKRKQVVSYLEKQKPELVIFNGHGADEEIYGHDGEMLICSKDDRKLYEKKVMFVRACSAGKVLGPLVVKNGAKAFIGYGEMFIFLTDPEKLAKPLEDEYAKPFLKASNEVALALLKGNNPQEAHEQGRRAHIKEIDSLLNSDSHKTYLIPFLQWNLVNQVCFV